MSVPSFVNSLLIPHPAIIASPKIYDVMSDLAEGTRTSLFGITAVKSDAFPYVNSDGKKVIAVMTDANGLIVGSFIEGEV